MANITVVNLPLAIALTGQEQVAIVQGGTSMRCATYQIAGVNPIAPVVVSGLPAASNILKGARAMVTDATAATYLIGASVTGGGSNTIPVFCNGLAWVAG